MKKSLQKKRVIIFIYFFHSFLFAAPGQIYDSTQPSGTPISTPLGSGVFPIMQQSTMTLLLPGQITISVAAPSCPHGYIPQIYVVPTTYLGPVVSAAYTPGLQPSKGVQPLYGIEAYAQAVPASGTPTSWNVGMSAYTQAGVWQPQTGYMMIVTQCCNPNAPDSSCPPS